MNIGMRVDTESRRVIMVSDRVLNGDFTNFPAFIASSMRWNSNMSVLSDLDDDC